MIINETTIRNHWRSLRFSTRVIARQFKINPDDLFGDVLERIWSRREQFTGSDKQFMQWSVCIAYNRCKDIRRYNRTRANITLPWDDERDIAQPGNPVNAIEAIDILVKFKTFITNKYGFKKRDHLWRTAKGYAIPRDGGIFMSMKRMRNKFILIYT